MLGIPPSTPYDWRFRLLNFPVRVNAWFWLLALVLGWNILGRLRPPGNIIELAVWVGCVLISILIHELGHALSARRFGASRISIVLYGMGGLAINVGTRTRRERIQVLLSGPGAGFIVGIPCFLLWKFVPGLPFPIGSAVFFMWRISLIWGLVNLVPVFPLDGGQVMGEVIAGRDTLGSRERMFKYSFIIAAGLAVLFLLIARVLNNVPDLFIIASFVILAVYNYQLFKNPGGMMPEGPDEPRESWQRPSDWWKK